MACHASKINPAQGFMRDQTDKKTKDKPPRPLKQSNIENMALSYLGRFATTTAHFRKVMLAKIERRCQRQNTPFVRDYTEMLDDVIKRFQDYGYLNDSAYIDSKIKGGLRAGQSLSKIQSLLFQKGVSREEIDEAITRYKKSAEEEGFGDLELKAALRLMRKKRMGCYSKTDPSSSLSPEDARKNKERFYRRMAGAGFSYDIVNRLYDMPHDEAEEIID